MIVDEQKYQLSQKQKMLAMALVARSLQKENVLAILMVLEGEEQIDDMVWYISNNPSAKDEELVAVAYQLAKEAREK